MYDNFLNNLNLSQSLNSSANAKFNNAKFNEKLQEGFKVESKEDLALKEQTDAFEAFLVKEVLDISMKHENELFGKDAGDEIYASMYNDTMSKALSGGMGFSKLLYDFLKNS